MAAVEITNADAIHPGYGFLAENAKFAQICADHGIKFIGPTPDMINKMGDKISAKETMIAAGVPVIPGSEGLLQSLEQAKALGKEMGFPVILKATAGGGGTADGRLDPFAPPLSLAVGSAVPNVFRRPRKHVPHSGTYPPHRFRCAERPFLRL